MSSFTCASKENLDTGIFSGPPWTSKCLHPALASTYLESSVYKWTCTSNSNSNSNSKDDMFQGISNSNSKGDMFQGISNILIFKVIVIVIITLTYYTA